MRSNAQQFGRRDDDSLRRYDYEEETVFVADLGTETGDATVDAVDGSAIVVAESGEQFEFALPDGAREPSIRNGVLTIEVAQ